MTNDENLDHGPNDLGHPAEIYIKLRKPSDKQRVDVLNFIDDNNFHKFMEKKMIYTEYVRDEIVVASKSYHENIDGEDAEERIERKKEAKLKITSAYKDDINFAMGFNKDKIEYKAYPLSSDVHKYFVFIRNDAETFEAIPVDNYYEMLPAPKNKLKLIETLEEIDNEYNAFVEKYRETGEEPKEKKKQFIGDIPFKKNKKKLNVITEDAEDSEHKINNEHDESMDEIEIDYGSDNDSGSGGDNSKKNSSESNEEMKKKGSNEVDSEYDSSDAEKRLKNILKESCDYNPDIDLD